MDPIATARYGMMAATQRLEAAAGRIATGGVDGADFAEDVTGLAEIKTQFKAQVKVIEIANEMWRDLIGLQASQA
jgi:hypothetical protein